MAWERHGHGMASVNQTRPRCVNQMGKTHSKPLVARHGRGTARDAAWARHAMCESAFRFPPFETVRESLKSTSSPHYILHEHSTEYPVYINKEESKLTVQTQIIYNQQTATYFGYIHIYIYIHHQAECRTISRKKKQ